MPIHDYHCRVCDKTFELLVSASEMPRCPQCGGADLEKLMSALAPPAKSPALIAGARRQAAREGHFSHYKRSERPRGR